MTNYKIVQDEQHLRDFLDWLPDTKESEIYYGTVFARNKYVRDIVGLGTFNSDKHQCARFLSKKDRFVEKLLQCEIEVGRYIVKGIKVPQEAIACYITPNPRDNKKGARLALVKFAELISNGSNCSGIHQEVITCVHKSVGTRNFVDFDFDGVTWDQLLEVYQLSEKINHDAINVVVTRGGLHLLVKPVKVDEKYLKTWHKSISGMDCVDATGDTMIPIPGTYQGGHTPRIFSVNEKFELCPI